jgi:hypothetical protein
MSSFPVIIKLRHLADLRRHIERRFNVSFNMVFKTRLARRYFSQFSIMCAYLYEHKRDEYVWNIHDRNPGWDRVNPAPKYGQSNYTPVSTPGQLAVLQVADHARYMIKSVLGSSRRRDYFDLMRKGICYSPPFPKPWFPFCDFLNISIVSSSSNNSAAVNMNIKRNNSFFASEDSSFDVSILPLFRSLFRFEFVNYLLTKSAKTALAVQRLHLQRIAHCDHAWPKQLTAYVDWGLRLGVATANTTHQLAADTPSSRWVLFSHLDSCVRVWFGRIRDRACNVCMCMLVFMYGQFDCACGCVLASGCVASVVCVPIWVGLQRHSLL